jgi:hypothetical protein
MIVLLAFTIAGYYIDRIAPTRHRAALKLSTRRKTRAKRRRGTWRSYSGTRLVWPGPARLSSPPPSFVLRAYQHVLMAPVARLSRTALIRPRRWDRAFHREPRRRQGCQGGSFQ